MVKKRNSQAYSKPPSTVHPSLSRGIRSAVASSSGEDRSASVNELLSHLRRSQANQAGLTRTVADRQGGDSQTSSVLNGSHRNTEIAGVPPQQANPRPTRRPPGPPPPPSWSESSTSRNQVDSESDARGDRECAERPKRLDRLPDLPIPADNSLQHLALQALARDWGWQSHYHQHYLAFLPPTLKPVLLSYIAVYSLHANITIRQLRLLFDAGDDPDEASDADDVTHLDLSGAIGRSISFKQLRYFLEKREPLCGEASSSASALDPRGGDDESWEADIGKLSLSTPATLMRFTNLTHLSLSHPGPDASWSGLLSVASHLAVITHLSLAYWPTPSLTRNAKTASAVSKHSPFSVSYGGSDFYSTCEGRWVEAAGILRRLSKATYCLKWLDLEGCSRWLDALDWAKNNGLEDQGPDWSGAWKDTIVKGVMRHTLPPPLYASPISLP
ncbi:MAG: hypothetical protein M1815_004780 [Lichina confinis]|nr:MAG: hypothetical protein M1815_004780 [Lichina confinis]